MKIDRRPQYGPPDLRPPIQGPPDHRKYAAQCAALDRSWREMHKNLGVANPRSRYYRLDADRQVIPCGMYEGTMVIEYGHRIVAQLRLPCGTFISTVFLGLDHNLHPQGPPDVFETMVFAPKGEPGHNGQLVERMSTWADAEAVHWATVKRYVAPDVYEAIMGVAKAAEGLKIGAGA